MISFFLKKKKSSLLSEKFLNFLAHKLGVKPVNERLYLEAITHSSYKNIQDKAKEKLKAYGIAPPAHKTKDKNILLGINQKIECPRCKTNETELVSQFSSTACKAMYRCISCLEPFEYFKCL